MRALSNIYRLGLKELASLRRDPVMVLLIVYSFTIAVYAVANGAKTEVQNAAVAIVDEDRSALSRRIQDAFLLPYFQPPSVIAERDVDWVMESGKYTFVVDIPPAFEADVLQGRRPAIQVNVDATAMSQAGNGAGYVARIVEQEVSTFLHGELGGAQPAVGLALRVRFNPNLNSIWFMSVVQIINSITLLAIVLTGAALIREREHGTIEHLLVMPLQPLEIMLAKIWASGLVVLIAAVLSFKLVAEGTLGVPVRGSFSLFLFGAVIYLFAVTSLGIFLATLARSMPQFGLLALPVFIALNLLSGGSTPLESMPEELQKMVQVLPSTHFVSFAQAILFRGAGLEAVWPQFLALAGIGAVLFTVARLRFRKTLSLVAG